MKWEYKVIDGSFPYVEAGQRVKQIEDVLNKLGKEGWELVIHSYDCTFYIFKRPLK